MLVGAGVDEVVGVGVGVVMSGIVGFGVRLDIVVEECTAGDVIGVTTDVDAIPSTVVYTRPISPAYVV